MMKKVRKVMRIGPCIAVSLPRDWAKVLGEYCVAELDAANKRIILHRVEVE
ncbi:MAG: hypothetical protein QXH97_03700 [Candidatus Bathyarchaeia archaeon]